MYVLGTGMISALGVGAERAAALMRCGYDGFMNEQEDVRWEGLVTAPCPLARELRGNQRLAHLLAIAAKDALSQTKRIKGKMAMLVCMDFDHYLLSTHGQLSDEVPKALQRYGIGGQIDMSRSVRFAGARVAFATALREAQSRFTQQDCEYIMIIGVSSMLNPRLLGQYIAQNRVATQQNRGGFIPGEAASAIVLGKKRPEYASTQILGVGIAEEPAPITGQQPLTGNGLTAAAREALAQANQPSHQIGLRIASVSGESYFFRELSIVQNRIIEEKVDVPPLWHPADSLGEIGAAIGGAMVIMGNYAFQKGYAPTPLALCYLSNDDKQRAAFVIGYRSGSR